MEHVSVLKEEAIEGLNIKRDGVYVDCTLGGGGHASEILRRLKEGHLYAFDQDPFAREYAEKVLAHHGSNYTIIPENFQQFDTALAALNVMSVDGALYDLGVSSFHFDDASRGFSYRHDARLDMRMNPEDTLDAHHIVNHYSETELKQILYRLGEESFAPSIARNILKARQQKPIETTFELVEIIKQSMPQKKLRQKGHPAKQTFQALRMAVNRELEVLETSLTQAAQKLNPGGRLVVITFHSLEDRLVKHLFKSLSTVDHPDALVTMPTTTPDFHLVNRKVILPSDEELAENPRAKSAKMRILERSIKT